MNQELFALGLFVFGFTLLYLMPASFHRSWKEIGIKPPSGDSVVFLLRIMGVGLIVAAFLFGGGVIDLNAVVPPEAADSGSAK